MRYNRIKGGSYGLRNTSPQRHEAGLYVPSFYYMKGHIKMDAELRLIRIGFPLSEAVGIVHQKRKDGDLEDFIREKEREYEEDCRRYAEEVIG